VAELDQRSGRGARGWGFEAHCGGGGDIGVGMVEGGAKKRGVAGWRAAGRCHDAHAARGHGFHMAVRTFNALRRLPLSLFSLKFWDLSLVSLVFSSSPAAFIVSMPPSLFSSLLFFY
jgi:hypothetical protein